MKTTLLLLIVFTGTIFSQQNFWEQTNGPYGGVISALAMNSKGYIFAGSNSGGRGI